RPSLCPLPLRERAAQTSATSQNRVRGCLRKKGLIAKRPPHPIELAAPIEMPSPARGEGTITSISALLLLFRPRGTLGSTLGGTWAHGLGLERAVAHLEIGPHTLLAMHPVELLAKFVVR